MKQHIVLFVEGDTDKVFFSTLLDYYRTYSKTPVHSCEVRNLKGISRYSRKVMGKLENEIIPEAKAKGMKVRAVCCSYDTDVFEFAERPVIDWMQVKRDVKRLGVEEFCRIAVQSMIEDWLLEDMDGLCRFLKLKSVPKVQGKDGNRKMLALFKRANRLYVKG